MAALVWDETSQRFFETAISKGVFYDVTGLGVAWNGLTSIEESVSNEVQAVHFDGLKFNDIVTIGDATAVLRAWTYPDEFLPYEGIYEDQSGFFVTNQPGFKFGLSYQTKVGNDVEGLEHGYKIHIWYNLTALPAEKMYQTLSDDVEAHEFEWTLTAIPEAMENYRPTAHVIFDSTKMDPWLLEDLEKIIYGDEDSPPHLPPLKGLGTFIRKWDRLIITDHGDGTWSAETAREGIIVMLDDTTFQITSDTAIYLDPETYTISSSEKNEEDIGWQP
jgi:hypothetical protein